MGVAHGEVDRSSIRIGAESVGVLVVRTFVSKQHIERPLGVAQEPPGYEVMICLGIGDPLDAGVTQDVDPGIRVRHDDR